MNTASSLGIAPGFQDILLKPGETYSGSISVASTSTDVNDLTEFQIFVAPFSVSDEEYTIELEKENDFNQISKWVTLGVESGKLHGKEALDIPFVIKVPEDAIGCGQYLAFVARVVSEDETEEKGYSIKINHQVASILYATIEGGAQILGEILENKVPNFVFDSPIQVSSLVKNDGNVHFNASYVMKVFPLFSNEEIYTTEESPKINTVIPGTSLYSSELWENSPRLGVFRVSQTISAFGSTSTVERTVFCCPIWFLTLWLIVIFGGIAWMTMRARTRRKISKQ